MCWSCGVREDNPRYEWERSAGQERGLQKAHHVVMTYVRYPQRAFEEGRKLVDPDSQPMKAGKRRYAE